MSGTMRSPAVLPASPADDDNGVRPRRDVPADLPRMQVHRPGAGAGHHQRRAFIPCRADGAEDAGVRMPLVPVRAGPAALFRPDAGQRALLARARLII